MPRTFYRLVKSDPPTPADFLSHYARGWEPRKKDSATLDRWRGVSVYETEGQARAIARKFPQIGRHIAMLQIPEGGPIRFERTGREDGHHTLWAEPVDLLGRVVSVVSV